MSDLQTQTIGAPPDGPPGLVGTDEGLPPERPRRGAWIALLVVAFVLVVAGGYAATRFFADADDRAIELVPRRSFAYANLFLEPSTSQQRAIRDLLERFPVKTPERARSLLSDLFDEGLTEIGLEFERDVEPWLGDQIAGFILPPESVEADPQGGVLIATEDEDATREALDKYRRKKAVVVEQGSYRGRDFERQQDRIVTGFVGSFLYVGTEEGFEAAVDAEESGRNLSGNRRFIRTTRDLAQDRLAIGYVDTTDLMAMVTEEGGPELASLAQSGLTGGQTQAAVLFATDEGIVVDQVMELPEGALQQAWTGIYGEPGIVEDLPEDTWVALSLPNAGELSRRLFGQIASFLPGGLGAAAANEQIRRDTGIDLSKDFFSWMDDAALFVSGTNRVDLGGGVLLSSKDPEASQRAVHRVAGVLIARGAPIEQTTFEWQGNVDVGKPQGDSKGYAVDIGAEEPLYFVAGGERVVVAYGDDAAGGALASSSYLGEETAWRTAVDSLGEDYVPFLFVDLPSARFAIESFGADQDEVYVEDVEPWLRPLSHVVSGTRKDGKVVRVRTVIGVQ